ncbi:MAG: filamentous hemagglutinin family protein, partial [Gammaproteobacteria bacterium]|nr:filamentous hemagglutinin family protein [Gammaproteobacteria bacterium]
AGLQAGEYARLPAHYALLPGAFLITPLEALPELTPGASVSRVDGAAVVAGRAGQAGSDRQGARSLGYLVEDGQRVRARAEYRETLASEFFAGTAGVTRTIDAGRVSLSAARALDLAARLTPTVGPGRGAAVDVSADRLALVAARTAAADRVEILAGDLASLGAASLLLGGTRAAGSEAVSLTASAREVTVEAGVSLGAPEIVLLARERVALAGGTALRGVGAGAPEALPVTLAGDGALLRVSSAGQVEVRRQAAAGSQGTLEVAAGTLLAGEGSVTLEASRDTRFAGSLGARGASVSLGSSRVSLGEPPAGTSGLVLGRAELDALDARELVLSSRSSIDLHGPVVLGGPQLDRLVLDAASVRGLAGGDSRMMARDVVLLDRRGASPPTPPAASGSLSVTAAGELLLAAGEYAFHGFERVRLSAGTHVRGEGTGRFQVGADLDLSAPWLTGTNGSDTAVSATGTLAVTQVPGDRVARDALGAWLALSGRELSFGGRVALPSGRLSLTADGPAGALQLIEGAVLDAAGIAVDFGEGLAGSPGGHVRLASGSGDLSVGAGVRLDVSGAPTGAAAGRLELSAPSGLLTVDATSRALGRGATPGEGGALRTDVSGLAAGALAGLVSWGRDGGFDAENRLRVRNGDLFLDGAGFQAREIAIGADGGRLTLAGTLDAGGTAGGRIELAAAGDLAVTGGARLLARATGLGGRGGSVLLETRGNLALAANALVDVSPGVGGDPGYLRLVVPRVGARDLGIAEIAGTVLGASRIDAVGNRSYSVASVTASTLSTVRADAADFMLGAAAVQGRLALSTDTRFNVAPGITLQSAGNLTLATDWDLAGPGWRPGGQAGLVTLLAGSDLVVNRSLSDGVVAFDPLGLGERETATSGASWSLRLVSGADFAAADPTAVRRGVGDVRVADGQRVRTGSGSIEVSAGRDVVLGGARAAVYTVGENRGGGPHLDPVIGEFLLGADFLHRGGDLRVRAGRDLRAEAASGQWVNQWLSRMGGEIENPDGSGGLLPLPTAWAVAVGEFRQHLGALAGGEVSIEAGRTVDRVSVAVATTGRPDAGVEGLTVAVAGGGTLRVVAGEDIRGGLFYLARGIGRIAAGGAIAAPGGALPTPALALGDASLEVVAGRDLALTTVFNPTVLPRGRNQGWRDDTGIDLDSPSYFFTYTPSSAVHLTSLAGNVLLANDTAPIERQTRPEALRPEVALEADVSAGFAGTTYPATLRALSLTRDLVLERPMRLFPAARGQLELLAARDVTTGGGPVSVLLPDADPLRLPTVAQPAISFDRAVQQLGLQSRDPSTVHAAVPVHSGDPEPARVVAGTGSIRPASDNALTLVVSKAARVSAGLDVSNLNLVVQHAAASDQTVVRAGRDIGFPTLRSGDGQFIANTNRIELGGPGRIDLIAGRNVDLGTSAGVLTVGNATNPGLPDGGADVAVLAGLGGPVDHDGFAQRYLGGDSAYVGALQSYLVAVGAGAGGGGDAVHRLLQLPRERQTPFLLESVLFGELLASGKEAAESGSGDYSRGFNAIGALFPGEDFRGEISLLLSRVSTLDGGSITLVAPGGRVNAGVTATTGLSKGAADLGVVAQREGDIRAFVRDDFEVNESRVFTLDGGDILIWSSSGDIDAGRGAKTAIAAPPPRVTFDTNGNAVVQFPPAVAGSGIRAAVTTPGRQPGSVSLFAPAGVVRAGDAGIESAGNLTIGAIAVIGSDNISAGGQSVGVPVAQTGSLAAGLTGVSNAATSATKATEAQATAVAEKQSTAASQAAAQQALALITVDVLGFGP